MYDVLLVYLFVWQRVDIQETTQPFLMELVQEAIMLWRESKSQMHKLFKSGGKGN